MHVLIATGGTAGHVVPALAVADALRADGATVEVVGGFRAEATLVPAAGYVLHQVRVQGLSRTNPLRAGIAAVRAAGAVARVWRLLGTLRPDVVLGGGGYVAGVVGLAAVLRRIPLVLTEADSHLGVSNRLLSRWARRVCLAFPIAGRDGERFVVTGRPVPPPWTDRAAARARFAVPDGMACVLVFGGSLGARSINLAAAEGLRDAGCFVVHATGRRDAEAVTASLGLPADGGTTGHYRVEPYIDPFAPALAAADLCVARSGGSVFEIAAHGVPAILIPYPHAAADHQTANARWMVDAGAAVMLEDAAVDAPRLRSEVMALLADPERMAAMSNASRGLARPDAAAAIAAEVRRTL